MTLNETIQAAAGGIVVSVFGGGEFHEHGTARLAAHQPFRDAIEALWMHADDPESPCPECHRALDGLVKRGGG